MTKVQIKDLLKKAANKRKGIGAIPVGLRFTIALVKMFVEAQFDIYNKVHINIIDEKTKKTIVKIDGVVRNKKDQAEKLLKYVVKNTNIDIERSSTYRRQGFIDKGKLVYLTAEKALLNNTKEIISQLSSEVNLYNKTPLKTNTMATKTKTMATKATSKKAALKADGTLKKGFKYAKGGRVVKAGAAATAKPAAKRTKVKKSYVKLRQTGVSKSKELDAKRMALKPGKRVSKAGNVYYEYRANRSDLKPRKKGRSL